MSHRSPIAARPWILALALALTSVVAVLVLVSPGYRWQPDEVRVAPYGNDFLQEWIGGHLILAGEAKGLYEISVFEARQHDRGRIGFEWSRDTYFPPVYPPPHYLLATCLAWLPYRLATLVWLLLLAIALAVGSWIAARCVVRFREIQCDGFAKNLLERWSWMAMVLFPASIFSLIMGQKGPFWLLILAATWGLLRKRREGWAGIVFGLLSIKPTLFFLLPIVMLRYGRWRFVAGATLTFGLLWGGALSILPIEVWSGFAEKLKMSSSYAGIQGYHLDWSCNLMSLSYLVSGPSETALLKWMLVLPLSLYGLWLVTESKQLEIDHPRTLWNILVVTFLLSPHAYYYDLVVMLVPILWYFAIDPKRGLVYYASLAAAVVLAPTFLAAIGIPLIPIVLTGIIIEQRLSCLAGGKECRQSVPSPPPAAAS